MFKNIYFFMMLNFFVHILYVFVCDNGNNLLHLC